MNRLPIQIEDSPEQAPANLRSLRKTFKNDSLAYPAESSGECARCRIQRDAWLSRVLRRKTGRLAFRTAPPGAEEREPLAAWDFIYAKVGSENLARVRFLEEAGFRLIDTNVYLEKPIFRKRAAADSRIRHSEPRDREGVMAVAAKSFRYSRFHLDRAFSGKTANRVKAQWAGGFFAGTRGTAMVVAEDAGEIRGFLLLIDSPEKILIDLIAVDPDCRNNGIATGLIRFAESDSKKCAMIGAGTQIANAPSLGLYEGLGFRIASSQYVFHYHRERRTK